MARQAGLIVFLYLFCICSRLLGRRAFAAGGGAHHARSAARSVYLGDATRNMARGARHSISKQRSRGDDDCYTQRHSAPWRHCIKRAAVNVSGA